MNLSSFLQNISIRHRLMLLLSTSMLAITISSGYIAYGAYTDKQNLEIQAEGYEQSTLLSQFSEDISSTKALFVKGSGSTFNTQKAFEKIKQLSLRQNEHPFLGSSLPGLKEYINKYMLEAPSNSTSQQFINYTTLSNEMVDAIQSAKKESKILYNNNSYLSDMLELETVKLPKLLDEISKILYQINTSDESKVEVSSRYIEQNLDAAAAKLTEIETWLKKNPKLHTSKFKSLKEEFESFSDLTYDFIFDGEKLEDSHITYNTLLSKYKNVSSELHKEIIKEIDSELKNVSTVFWITIALMITIVITLIVFSIFVNISIIRPLSQFSDLVLSITKECDFSVRANQFGNNELGRMGDAFNNLIATLEQSFNEINIVIDATSNGDLEKTIAVEGAGDVHTLINGVNSSVANIRQAFKGIDAQMQMLKEGNFQEKIENTLPGEFGKIVDIVADTKESLSNTIADISQALSSLANGELNERVTSEAKGDILTLKENVNISIEQVATAVDTIEEMASHIAQGDLTHRIETKVEGKFDQICQALNTSMDAMKETMSGVISSAQELTDEANQVLDNSRDISRHIQGQASSIEETSSSMEEMNMTVRNNADSSDVAKQLSADARDETARSIEVMKETTKSMKGIEEMSAKVHEIIQVIDEIAFQTNLLALNANVEAARAGDHGRGFAVVAGEVRNLAQKSAEAAKEIKDLVESSVHQTKEGSELVDKTSAVLNNIDEKFKEAADVFAEISAASNEQAQGIEQVSKAILSMDKTTQENSTRVEQSAATAESMATKASKLLESMSGFKTQ